MGKINWIRIVLGGLLAGVIIDVVESIENGVILADAWSTALVALGRPAQISLFGLALFNLWGLGIGIMAVWTYSAIRPRFGPGPKTAIIAAVATWIVGGALAGVFPVATGTAPKRLMAITAAVGLAEMVVATLAGAYLYKEEATPQVRSAGAGTR